MEIVKYVILFIFGIMVGVSLKNMGSSDSKARNREREELRQYAMKVWEHDEKFKLIERELTALMKSYYTYREEHEK